MSHFREVESPLGEIFNPAVSDANLPIEKKGKTFLKIELEVDRHTGWKMN